MRKEGAYNLEDYYRNKFFVYKYVFLYPRGLITRIIRYGFLSAMYKFKLESTSQVILDSVSEGVHVDNPSYLC